MSISGLCSSETLQSTQDENKERPSQKRPLSLSNFVSPECCTFVNAFLITSKKTKNSPRRPSRKKQSASGGTNSRLPSTPVSSTRRLRCRSTPRLARTRSALLLSSPDAARSNKKKNSVNLSQTVAALDLPRPDPVLTITNSSESKSPTAPDSCKPPPLPPLAPSHLQSSHIYSVWRRHIITNTETLSRVASSSLEQFRLAIFELSEAEQLLLESSAAFPELTVKSNAPTAFSETKSLQLKPRRSPRLQSGERSSVTCLRNSVCKQVRFCSADLSTCAPPSYGEMGSQEPFERLARHLVSSRQHINIVPPTDFNVLRLAFQPKMFEDQVSLVECDGGAYSFAAGRAAYRFIVSELFHSSERLQSTLISLVRFYMKSIFNADDFLPNESSITNSTAAAAADADSFWPSHLLNIAGADVGALICLHLRTLHHCKDDDERTASLNFFHRMRSAFSGRFQFVLGVVDDSCSDTVAVFGEGVPEPADGLYAASVRVEILRRWQSLRVWLSHATQLCDSLAWMRPLLDLPSFLQSLPLADC